MYWPLQPRPVPFGDIPTNTSQFIDACDTPADPTMLWGTDFPTEALERFVREQNRHASVVISPAHVLIKAVGMALKIHPNFNRRLIGRQQYAYREVNVLMAFHHVRAHRADAFLIKEVDERGIESIAAEVWGHGRDAASGKFRYDEQARLYSRLPGPLRRWMFKFNLWLMNRWNLPAGVFNERQRCAPVLVNYLAFPDAPPMRAYKPSRMPIDSYTLNVTMGATEPRAVVERGEVVVRRIAPLFVRADHRLVDACDLGRFVQTLRGLLASPERLVVETSAEPTSEAPKKPIAAVES